MWGYHLILDVSGLRCSVDKLNDVLYLKAFVAEMLDVTGMKAWGDCLVSRLTAEDGDFPDALSGYTVVQLLHTSNLTMHVCDKADAIYFDLFSCSKFDSAAAVGVLQKYFEPQSVRETFLTRQA